MSYLDPVAGAKREGSAAAISAADIAAGAVGTSEIEDASIAAGDIASNAVTTAKILDANVTTAKIADANVTTAKIADLNVTTGKLAAAAVTAAKAAAFVSAEQTGTGSSQNVAHGLGVTPASVLISVTEHPGTPDTGAFDVAEGTHTSTNVVVTVTANVKFKVFAWA